MPGCEHKESDFLMRRDGIDYVECRGCGEVFEAEDLEQQVSIYDDEPDGEVKQDDPAIESIRRKKAS